MNEAQAALTLSESDIDNYIANKLSEGLAKTSALKYRSHLSHLSKWLPEDKILTKERLLAWRRELEEYGYSKVTVEKYVIDANLYVKYMGRPDLNIKKSHGVNLGGMQFGYLNVISPVSKTERGDIVWLCKCKCGSYTEVLANSLTMGNTSSCGCLRAEVLNYTNRYVDGTDLRQSMSDNPISARSKSGYTGVTKYKNKWRAYIVYKKKYYSLGTFAKLEDAVKARARAKDEVKAHAEQLYAATEHLYSEKPARPPKPKAAEKEEKAKNILRSKRYDNKSGIVGVYYSAGKWCANISYKKQRYDLGRYDDRDEAISVRQLAEKYLLEGNIEAIAEIKESVEAIG